MPTENQKGSIPQSIGKPSGRTPGSGKPKGYKAPQTLEKEQARQRLREMVFARVEPIVEAHIANAMGTKALIYRDKRTGKFVPVKIGELERVQDLGEVVEVWEEKPNVQSLAYLFDQALDKAKNPVQEVEVGFKDLGDKIKAARERVGRR